MIHDAKMGITCDGCGEYLEYEMPYVYRDYTGTNGFYDDDEEKIIAWLEKQGWVADGKDHYCEDCAEDIGITAKNEQ